MGRKKPDNEAPVTEKHESPKKPRQGFALVVRPLLIAAIPVTLAVCYFVWVAPTLVPVSPEAKVPFRPAIPYLEDGVRWCSEHSLTVLLCAIGLMVPGLLYRSRDRTERYYLRLAIIVSLVLGFAYFSISAPIDRFMHAVEENVPQDQRVPDHRGDADE